MSAHSIIGAEHDDADPGSGMAARRPVCLVLMPMYTGFEEIRACVARVLDSAGLEMRRLEKEIEDSAWHLWLLDSAQEPDMVLVDLTDNNPFVMYELGYVHYRRLPIVFIMNASEQRMPAMVRGAVCSAYGDGCEYFEHDLIEHLRSLGSVRQDILRGNHNGRLVAAPELYEMARTAVDKLDAAIGRRLSRVDESEFWLRLDVSRRRGVPDPAYLAGRVRDRYLMTLLAGESDRVDIMQAICACSFGRLPASSNSNLRQGRQRGKYQYDIRCSDLVCPRRCSSCEFLCMASRTAPAPGDVDSL